MRKINKHTQAIIIAAVVALLIIGILVAWMLYQYKSMTSPGSSSNDVSYTQGEKIPSVSGTGHVAGDDDKNTPPVDSTTTNQSDKKPTKLTNGGTDNTTVNRKSGDPVYTSPSANGKNSSYKHVIDTHCYDTVHTEMMNQANQQMESEMNSLDAATTKKVKKLLSDINKAKPEIRASTPQYEGEYAYLNKFNDSREKAPIPKPTDEPSKVLAYANAWTTDKYKFGDRASEIYKARDNQVAVIGKKYNITCS